MRPWWPGCEASRSSGEGARARGIDVRGATARGRDIDLVAFVVITGALIVGGWLLVGPMSQTRPSSHYPVALLSALDEVIDEQVDARLFNEYTWGGWLETRPDLPVFIDGHSEVCGDPQLEPYAAITEAAPARPRPHGSRPTLALVGPAHRWPPRCGGRLA
jgi:hypothetical protein